MQLGLNLLDRDVVRFLWVKDINAPFADDNIQEYRFCRVIWGIGCAALLLAYTIAYHLSLYNNKTSENIMRDIYVDNLVSGESSAEAAIAYYRETKAIFNAASIE